MSLVTRLSAFFLVALAVVLVGFSIVLYFLAERYLYRQLDAQLATALETLQAAVDVESDGLDWNPAGDRPITVGTDAGLDQLRWVVVNGLQRIVAHSANYDPATFPTDWRPAVWPTDPPDGTAIGQVGNWRVGARRLRVIDLAQRKDAKPVRPPDNDAEDDESDELFLVSGISSAPVATNVQELAAALVLLTAAFWVVCALVGRRLCQQALQPLVEMAVAAREMSAADRDRQLPSPQTGDELEALGQAFNDLLSRMQRAIDEQQRFAGDASHQLRTPLTGMLSTLEVARRRERSAADYAQVLDQVHAEAVRMRQIVESLLFLARGDSDRMQLEREPIELDAWLQGELARWTNGPRGSDLRAELHLEPGAWIGAQPVLLAQLLDNLLDNATKYSPTGASIFVRSWREGGSAGFSVADEGPGIAPADLPHVFEPFFRSEAARRAGRTGVGLGLAVAQRIIASLGGSIRVESPPGRGTNFVVALPELSGHAFGAGAARPSHRSG
jgi:two-component system, OmpR family, sensor kinase